VELHVARALEFLVDDIVHARSGLDQRGSQYGYAAAFLEIPRCAEELLRRVQRTRVETARERPAGRWHLHVVGSGEPSDRIQKDHYILAAFREALCALYYHLRHLHMMLGLLIERGIYYLGVLQAPLHVCDFLRSLVNEQHYQLYVRILVFDRSRDLLEQHCLARLWLRNDKASLASADRRHQVHHSRRKVDARILKHDLLVCEDRGEAVEVRPPFRCHRIEAVDGFDK